MPMLMDPGEILREYRTAAKKDEQITVLADPGDGAGRHPPQESHHRPRPETGVLVQARHEGGMSRNALAGVRRGIASRR